MQIYMVGYYGFSDEFQIVEIFASKKLAERLKLENPDYEIQTQQVNMAVENAGE